MLQGRQECRAARPPPGPTLTPSWLRLEPLSAPESHGGLSSLLGNKARRQLLSSPGLEGMDSWRPSSKSPSTERPGPLLHPGRAQEALGGAEQDTACRCCTRVIASSVALVPSQEGCVLQEPESAQRSWSCPGHHLATEE